MIVPVGFQIVEILTQSLGEDLLAVNFNLESNTVERYAAKLAISDDGETIGFIVIKGFVTESSLKTESPDVLINRTNQIDVLHRLVGQRFRECLFGIGRQLRGPERLLFYVLLRTDNDEFLFFNNGDSGAFSFENISEILEHDIFDVEWCENYSGILQKQSSIL